MRSRVTLLIVFGIAVTGCQRIERSQQVIAGDSLLAARSPARSDQELIADVAPFVDSLFWQISFPASFFSRATGPRSFDGPTAWRTGRR